MRPLDGAFGGDGKESVQLGVESRNTAEQYRDPFDRRDLTTGQERGTTRDGEVVKMVAVCHSKSALVTPVSLASGATTSPRDRR